MKFLKSKIKSRFFTCLIGLTLLASFQNCTSQNFAESNKDSTQREYNSISEIATAQNGSGYSGKILAKKAANGLCADGSDIEEKILLISDQTGLRDRKDCNQIIAEQVDLSSAQFILDAAGALTQMIFESSIFVEIPAVALEGRISQLLICEVPSQNHIVSVIINRKGPNLFGVVSNFHDRFNGGQVTTVSYPEVTVSWMNQDSEALFGLSDPSQTPGGAVTIYLNFAPTGVTAEVSILYKGVNDQQLNMPCRTF